jgi:beta-lactam-binding protein with PASTA domain
VRRKPDEGSAFNKSFSDAQSNGKTISTASASTKLINNCKAILIDVSGSTSASTTKLYTREIDAYLRIKAVSLISDANVETLASILSSMETRAKI